MAAHPETAAQSLLPADSPPDPKERLDAVIDAFTKIIVETEAQQRTMLRLSLEADDRERAGLPLRQGRAIGWIEEALTRQCEVSHPTPSRISWCSRSAARPASRLSPG